MIHCLAATASIRLTQIDYRESRTHILFMAIRLHPCRAKHLKRTKRRTIGESHPPRLRASSSSEPLHPNSPSSQPLPSAKNLLNPNLPYNTTPIMSYYGPYPYSYPPPYQPLCPPPPPRYYRWALCYCNPCAPHWMVTEAPPPRNMRPPPTNKYYPMPCVFLRKFLFLVT